MTHLRVCDPPVSSAALLAELRSGQRKVEVDLIEHTPRKLGGLNEQRRRLRWLQYLGMKSRLAEVEALIEELEQLLGELEIQRLALYERVEQLEKESAVSDQPSTLQLVA